MVSGDDEILQTVEQYGANDFIKKPFNSEEVIKKINVQLELKKDSA